MRILALSSYYPPDMIGGYEQTAHTVLSALSLRGHEVTVLTGRADAALDASPPFDSSLPNSDVSAVVNSAHETKGAEASGVSVRRLLHRLPLDESATEGIAGSWLSNRTYVRNEAITCETIRAVQPDILHFWCGGLLTSGVLAACEASGLPMVFHLGDMWLLSAFQSRGQGVGAAVMRLFRKMMGAKEAVFSPEKWGLVFVSESLRAGYRAGGFPEAESMVVANGCGADASPRSWPDVAPDITKICFSGRLRPNKGVEVLLRALAIWRDAGGRCVCDVYGSGDAAYTAHLRGVASSLGLDEVVRWCGGCAHEAMLAAYREHDLLVVPSLWEEPFGLVAIEAMSAGVPVLATDRGALPEIITSDVGWTASPEPEVFAKALASIVADWPAWRAKGRAAPEYARKRFSWPDKVDAIEQFLLQRVAR